MTPEACVNDITLYEWHTSGPAMTYAIFAINLMALAQQTQNESYFVRGEEEFEKSYQYLGGISGGSWNEGSRPRTPGTPCHGPRPWLGAATYVSERRANASPAP